MSNLQVTPLRAVIFDFDDTIIRSFGDRSVKLVEALSSFGMSPRKDGLGSVWGRSFRDVIFELDSRAAYRYEEFVEYYSEYLLRFPPEVEPGLDRIIRRASARIPLLIHSASDSRLIASDLRSLDLLDCFSVISASNEQSLPKPAHESMAQVVDFLASMAIPLTDVVYIGDSMTDFVSARCLDIPFLATTYFRNNWPAFESSGLGRQFCFGSASAALRSTASWIA